MNFRYFWKPLLWLAFICYGLLSPAEKLPSGSVLDIPHIDKAVHFFLFSGLCVLLFQPFKKLNKKHYLWAPLTAIGISSLLELSQQIIAPSRSSDLLDFLANLAGILFATLFYYYLVANKKWESLF